ncbi:MAG: hypothetical protein EPN73_22610 [Paraburkholderia sp.]|uniref:hypothetical protein n=1 Tax=Paraburkholderia sp. TaxID=1926495 RepID=UPI00121EFEDC|nr:hypothetical protein [Paraburkholderia sp.]TAL93166.1 MAG: hypothetical protein EPN73_22610 [Paraburkholderia sp.]
MRVSEASSTDFGTIGSNMREGVLEQKFLLQGQPGSPNNYLINVGRTGSGGWAAPSHRHNFDQLRYVMKGKFPYGEGKTMPEGWVGYFPESVYYGPQARPEGLEMMVVQFGGSSGYGFASVEEREAANQELKKTGEFKDGIYTWYDEAGKKHNQDGFEACFEKVMGRKLEYAKPRYHDLILMNPANYEWIPEPTPGVFTKLLGAFTERNTRVGFVKIEAGATFAAGMQSSIELLFLAKGKVSYEGKEYGLQTVFESQANEGPIPLKALEETEFLRLIMPTF